jgi:hypothetical protein
MSDESHGGFTYKGSTYYFSGKASMGELAWCERRLGVNRGTFTPHEMMIVAYWVTLTRAWPGRPKGGVWQEIYDADGEAFEDIPMESVTEPEEPELPEHEWPLDPTVAGTETAHPSGSGPNVQTDPSA